MVNTWSSLVTDFRGDADAERVLWVLKAYDRLCLAAKTKFLPKRGPPKTLKKRPTGLFRSSPPPKKNTFLVWDLLTQVSKM